MMKKCSNSSQVVKHFLFSTKRNDDCQKVPAMRCRIEKRKVRSQTHMDVLKCIHTLILYNDHYCSKYIYFRYKQVIKTKPETTCKRMPRQFCRNEDCKDTHKTSTANILDEELCYYRIQMVRTLFTFLCSMP